MCEHPYLILVGMWKLQLQENKSSASHTTEGKQMVGREKEGSGCQLVVGTLGGRWWGRPRSHCRR